MRFNGEQLSHNIFNTNTKFRIATTSREYYAQDAKENVTCNIDEQFGQFGVYDVNVVGNDCEVVTLKEPKNIYLRKYIYQQI